MKHLGYAMKHGTTATLPKLMLNQRETILCNLQQLIELLCLIREWSRNHTDYNSVSLSHLDKKGGIMYKAIVVT